MISVDLRASNRVFSVWPGLLGSLILVLFSGFWIPATAQSVSANPLLRQMMAIATDNGGMWRTEELNALKQQIEALPKPQRGNRLAARQGNDQGLQAFKAGQHEQAKQFLQTAYQADPGDVEIANNLGMIALKVGDPSLALRMLAATLSMSPGRSSAWANLAEYFALQGNPEKAVACYALTFHFTKNPDRTRNFLQQQASSADSAQVQQAAQEALQLSLIQGSGTPVASAGAALEEDSLDVPLPSPSAPATSAPMNPPTVETPLQAQREQLQLAQNAANTLPISASSTTGVQIVVSEGLGTDIPSAAQNAAQNALTNVVGSFIDSTKLLEKRVEIQEGIRSQTSRIDTNIKEYSQGSIQHFELLETSEQSGLTKVTAKVTVRIDDFKAYIKKLAEGKAAVDVGLFSSLSTGAKQKENLEKIVVDLISPIAKGEVSRFEVGKPVSLEEGKKAIDELYLKIKNKFGDHYNLIENYRRQVPTYVDEFSKKYDQYLIVYIHVTVTIDPGFYENARKTLESIAHEKKKYKIRCASVSDCDSYYGYKQDMDIMLGVVGIQGSPIVGDVYTLKNIGISLTKKFRWLAAGNFRHAVERGDYSFKNIAPHLEIDFVDANGQIIKSFGASFSGGRPFMDGSMLIPDPVNGDGAIGRGNLPWSLLISSHTGSTRAFPLIISKREFGIFLALDESTLKNARDVKLSLVPPSSSQN